MASRTEAAPTPKHAAAPPGGPKEFFKKGLVPPKANAARPVASRALKAKSAPSAEKRVEPKKPDEKPDFSTARNLFIASVVLIGLGLPIVGIPLFLVSAGLASYQLLRARAQPKSERAAPPEEKS